MAYITYCIARDQKTTDFVRGIHLIYHIEGIGVSLMYIVRIDRCGRLVVTEIVQLRAGWRWHCFKLKFFRVEVFSQTEIIHCESETTNRNWNHSFTVWDWQTPNPNGNYSLKLTICSCFTFGHRQTPNQNWNHSLRLIISKSDLNL